MEGLDMQTLLPVRVPWQVSPSTSFLRLSVAETQEPTYVTCVAHFGLEHEDDSELARDQDDVQFVTMAGLELRDASGPYQLVRLTFDAGAWARMYPGYSDAEVVKEDAYDWSAIPCL